MTDRSKVFAGVDHHLNSPERDKCLKCPYYTKDLGVSCREKLLSDVYALLKAQGPDEDWISRKRLKDEIQYYIDEAGWGNEANKVLSWCLEFIDNQRNVNWYEIYRKE